MTKNKIKIIDNKLPFVSVCTPTFNRRPFVEMMIKCFDNQDYPKNKMEWIIIDDGTDPIEDLVKSHPIVKYFKYDQKMTLGKKRNIMHKESCGDIIVYMYDDDYYPSDRVSHAVERLTNNPGALCAGSSEMYIYFKDNKEKCKMVQFGPYGPNHATAGTFAFKRKLLKDTKYNEDACLAEEREFLKNYTVPFVQLDPLKTILVFSHSHNTFDKRTLLDKMESNQYIKYSTRSIGDFIKDKDMIKFFVEDLEEKLKIYEPGNINMKPDVLKQIKELEITRKEMERKIMEDRQKNMDFFNKNIREQSIDMPSSAQMKTSQPTPLPSPTTSIVFREEGKPPRELNHNEIVEMLTSQQKQLSQMAQLKELYGNTMRENVRLKEIIEIQQKILDDKNLYIGELETKIAESSEIILIDVDKH
jgi:glycosyltransferase involved in cell wall biosynthesis